MKHKTEASLAFKKTVNKTEIAHDEHIKFIGDFSNLTAKLKKRKKTSGSLS